MDNAEMYRYYFQQAKGMRKSKKIRHKATKLGAPIPRRPREWTDPGVPIPEGWRAPKTALNRVLHKYPGLLSVYFKPTPDYTILTPYLKTRRRKGYAFFPDMNGRWNSHRTKIPNASQRLRSPQPQSVVQRPPVRIGLSNSNNNQPSNMNRRIRRQTGRFPIRPIRSRSRSRSISTSSSNMSGSSSGSFSRNSSPNSYKSNNYQSSLPLLPPRVARPPPVPRGMPLIEGVSVVGGTPLNEVAARVPLVRGVRMRVRNTR